MKHKYNDFTCIVRTVGERTTKCCVCLLRRFFGGNAVHVVSRSPFNAALRESMSLALKLGKPWTLMIDADVLCSEKGLAKMLDMARCLPDTTYMFHASVADKFFGRYRRAGNRIYQTAALADALEKVPCGGESLRPEFHTCEAMRKAGWRNYQSYQIIGLHDYGQFFTDILRKAALFGLKHDGWGDYFERLWQAESEDLDFQAALEALKTCSREQVKVEIGLSLLERIPARVREKWAAREKAPLAEDGVLPDEVDMLIAAELGRRGITPTTDIEPRELGPCAE